MKVSVYTDNKILDCIRDVMIMKDAFYKIMMDFCKGILKIEQSYYYQMLFQLHFVDYVCHHRRMLQNNRDPISEPFLYFLLNQLILCEGEYGNT